MTKIEAPEPQVLYVQKRQKQAKKAKRTRTRQPDPEDMVRDVCGKRLTRIRAKEAQPMRYAYQMADIYSEMFARYYGRPHHVMNMRKRLEEKKSTKACFLRAVAQAQMLGALFREYMEAQFYWISDYHGRPPRYPEIASAAAIVRYRRWKELDAEGSAPAFQVHPAVVGGVVDPRQTPPEVVARYETDVLDRMIRQTGSEKDVWLLCGELGDNEVFTDGFKRTRPVWRELYERQDNDTPQERDDKPRNKR